MKRKRALSGSRRWTERTPPKIMHMLDAAVLTSRERTSCYDFDRKRARVAEYIGYIQFCPHAEMLQSYTIEFRT